MRYLKYFEVNIYYNEIPFQDFKSYENGEKISDKYINIIKKLLVKEYYIDVIGLQTTDPFLYLRPHTPDKNKYFSYSIYQAKDEWFYIAKCELFATVKCYYKVDQFEGLLDFLKNEKVTK